MDTTFERVWLKQMTADARKRGAKISDAWVYEFKRGRGVQSTWEFHYKDFYFCTRAENAFDAKAQGWEAWLVELETREREKHENVQKLA